MWTQNLQLQINLSIEGQAFSVSGGHITDIDVSIQNYGFSAHANFWLDSEKDQLFASFISKKLIIVELSIDYYYNRDLEDTKYKPILLTGIVTKKQVTERCYIQMKDNQKLNNEYSIYFSDPAKILWGQHYPSELYTDNTLKAVIEDHLVDKINLKLEWSVLDKKHPIIFLGLGDKNNKASFYDWLMWFIHSNNGVWNYDHQTNEYKITGQKITKPSFPINTNFVERVDISFPETQRHNWCLLNGYSETPQRNKIESLHKINGLRKDIVLIEKIQNRYNERKNLEENRFKIREHEVSIFFNKFPNITFAIGEMFSFEGFQWNKDLFNANKNYRVIQLEMKAEIDGNKFTYKNSKFAPYEIISNCVLETEEEKHVHFPSFQTPYYPTYAEGKIVSEQWQEEEETFQVYKDQKTQEDFYRVKIPLWDNQEVITSFHPNLISGHFFFPLYKNERVLIGLHFMKAVIQNFIDWRPGARLPMKTQGNQILMGISDVSKTHIKYFYENKKPIFSIKRRLENDTELICLQEGHIILKTEEEDGS